MLPEFEQFKAVVGEAIELEFDGERLPARIDEVNASKRHSEEGRQPFSVLLISDVPGPMEQQIFTLHQPTLGSFELFLVPIGPKDGGMAYEAVFN